MKCSNSRFGFGFGFVSSYTLTSHLLTIKHLSNVSQSKIESKSGLNLFELLTINNNIKKEYLYIYIMDNNIAVNTDLILN